MSIDDGGPAFPLAFDDERVDSPGLSRRDWFATFAPEPTDAAVAGYLRDGDNWTATIADLRYAYADAMIAASKREPR